MKSASALRSADIDRPSAPPRQPPAKQHLTTRGFRVALSTALGLPFVYSLGAALRGELFVGRYYFFGGTSSMATFVAWTVVSALGSLWLGVSLRLGLPAPVPERARGALADLLILAGVTGLIFGARLLSIKAGA